MRLRRALFLGALAVVAMAAACTLNPQPLPPGADPLANPERGADASFGSTTDGSTTTDPNNPADASGANPDGSQTSDGDSAPPNGDAGDGGGEGGDAATDAADSG